MGSMNSIVQSHSGFAKLFLAGMLFVTSMSSHAGNSTDAGQRVETYVSGSISVQNITMGKPIQVTFENNDAGTDLLGAELQKIGYKVQAQANNTVRASVTYLGQASDRPAFGALEKGKTYGSFHPIDNFNDSFHGRSVDMIASVGVALSSAPMAVLDLVGRTTGVAGWFDGLIGKVGSKKKDPIVSMIVELQTPFSQEPVFILVDSLEKDVSIDEMLKAVIDKAVWFLST